MTVSPLLTCSKANHTPIFVTTITTTGGNKLKGRGELRRRGGGRKIREHFDAVQKKVENLQEAWRKTLRGRSYAHVKELDRSVFGIR